MGLKSGFYVKKYYSNSSNNSEKFVVLFAKLSNKSVTFCSLSFFAILDVDRVLLPIAD
jgi:hypothetical protein